MRKKLIWGTAAIALIIFIVGIAFFISRLFNSIDKVIEDKPTAEQQAIIDTSFETKETIATESIDSSLKVYDMMHQMANGKIIAEDGQIWGVEPMTRDRILACKKAIKYMEPKNEELLKILDRWENEDFSKCVEDHNYLWTLLNGNIGKAIALRKKP